jgi:hypothetical protein
MDTRAVVFGAFAVLALSSCGGTPEAEASAGEVPPRGGARAAAVSESDELSAEEVARARRGPVACPARQPARSAGASVDDVLGVRPGMALNDAITGVLCSHPLMIVHLDSTSNRFNLQTFGTPLVQSVIGTHAKAQQKPTARSSKQILADMQRSTMDRGNNRARRDLSPGESAWLIGTMGLPGQERVTDVAREEWYAEGEEPAMSVLEEALVTKYGPATLVQRNPGRHVMRWAFLANGTRLGEAEANRCSGNPYRAAAVSFLEDCGTVVEVVIDGRRDNPAIAQTLHIRSMQQANAYALIEKTSAALQSGEAARRREQVEQAKKRGTGPVL